MTGYLVCQHAGPRVGSFSDIHAALAAAKHAAVSGRRFNIYPRIGRGELGGRIAAVDASGVTWEQVPLHTPGLWPDCAASAMTIPAGAFEP